MNESEDQHRQGSQQRLFLRVTSGIVTLPAVGFEDVSRWAYNESMARGWESKGIEDQISAAEAKEAARAKETLTATDIERRKRIESLQLERTRLERELRVASKRRHLVMLERALTHIEAELARLEQSDSAE